MSRHLSRSALALVVIALVLGTFTVLDASARQRDGRGFPGWGDRPAPDAGSSVLIN